MPKITTPVTGPGPTTSSFPADRITHMHHSPKGESGPNPSGRPFDNGDSGVKTEPAVTKGLNWGSDAHGGPQYDHGNSHGGLRDVKQMETSRNEQPGRQYGSDAHRRRGVSG